MQPAPRAKRRKWDDTGSGSPAAAAAATVPSAMGAPAFVVPAQYAVSPQAARGAPTSAAKSAPAAVPGQINADVIARAQQGAAAAMEKINRWTTCRNLGRM